MRRCWAQWAEIDGFDVAEAALTAPEVLNESCSGSIFLIELGFCVVEEFLVVVGSEVGSVKLLIELVMEGTVEQLLERMARRTVAVIADNEDGGLIPQHQMVLKPQPLGDINQLLEKAEQEKRENILKKAHLETEKEALRARLRHLRQAKDNAEKSLHSAVELQKTQQLKKQELLDDPAAAGMQDPANLDGSESRSSVGEELKKLERDTDVQPCLARLIEKAQTSTKDYDSMIERLLAIPADLQAIELECGRLDRWIKALTLQMQLMSIRECVKLYPQPPRRNASSPACGPLKALQRIWYFLRKISVQSLHVDKNSHQHGYPDMVSC